MLTWIGSGCVYFRRILAYFEYLIRYYLILVRQMIYQTTEKLQSPKLLCYFQGQGFKVKCCKVNYFQGFKVKFVHLRVTGRCGRVSLPLLLLLLLRRWFINLSDISISILHRLDPLGRICRLKGVSIGHVGDPVLILCVRFSSLGQPCFQITQQSRSILLDQLCREFS